MLELTDVRAKPAVHFGGKTRIIDFALSNALNSGISVASALPPSTKRNKAPIRHLFTRHGLFYAKSTTRALIFYPPVSASMRTRGTKARPDAAHQNIDIIEGYAPKYIVILAGRPDIKWIMRPCWQHVNTGADITLGCIEVPRMEATGFGVMHVRWNDAIIDFVEKTRQSTRHARQS